uniref:SAP domain-containing ribonucleoprotein n=1 Tax=Macaca nemestrina TaxID=9545 RepID=A0A2K6DLW7_MACNE
MATETVEFHKLKLAELKQECLACGLETKGIKQDLIHRLQAYLEEHLGRRNGVNPGGGACSEPRSGHLHSSRAHRARLRLKKKKKKGWYSPNSTRPG